MIKREGNFFTRLIKFVFSVVILSAFIIGIAFSVKYLSKTDIDKISVNVAKVLALASIHIEDDKVGQVAGKFIERVSNTNISASSSTRISAVSSTNLVEDINSDTNTKLRVLEIGVIADVQGDLASLQRSLNGLKDRNINKVIVIGDLTNYGDVPSLEEVKKVLDESGLKYYVLPGDHDLAQSVGPDNYLKVFNQDNYVVDMEGYKFLFLNNSANFTPLVGSKMTWFKDEVTSADFVILSQPLYTDGLNLPFKKLYMGSTLDETKPELVDSQQRVKDQRDTLLKQIEDSSALAIIAGDHHKSNELVDSVRSDLLHVTLGSIGSDVNGLPQRILQSPRFSILNVYEDKTFDTEEILID